MLFKVASTAGVSNEVGFSVKFIPLHANDYLTFNKNITISDYIGTTVINTKRRSAWYIGFSLVARNLGTSAV